MLNHLNQSNIGCYNLLLAHSHFPPMPYPHSPRLFCQIYLDNGTYGISHYGRKLIFGVGFGRDDDKYCGGPYGEHPKREHICGRPLGLCFSKHTGELYVADAYKGLVVVGPNGGTATGVTSQVEVNPWPSQTVWILINEMEQCTSLAAVQNIKGGNTFAHSLSSVLLLCTIPSPHLSLHHRSYSKIEL